MAPPKVPAFALLATRDLGPDAVIGEYAGELCAMATLDKDVDHANFNYTYSVDHTTLPGYTGPDLGVNARQRGNALRFVNDDWGREQTQERNCYVQQDWTCPAKGPARPRIVFRTTGVVQRGEEVVSHYGRTSFWSSFAYEHLRLLSCLREDLAAEVACLQLKTGGSSGEKPLPRPPLEELWYDFEQDRYHHAVCPRVERMRWLRPPAAEELVRVRDPEDDAEAVRGLGARLEGIAPCLSPALQQQLGPALRAAVKRALHAAQHPPKAKLPRKA